MSDAALPAKRPKVLVFCRPYLVPDFTAMTEPLASRFQFRFLTDGRCPGTQDTRAIFYANLKARNRSPEIDPELQEDVRIRCRLLRKLEPETARDLLHAMALSLAEFLDRERPELIFSQLTDEYVTHLLAVIAARRGINTVQTCYAYFQNRMQFFNSTYGVALEGISNPARSEAKEVLHQLEKLRHRQDYNVKAAYAWPRHVKRVLRYLVKRAVFAVYALRDRDPWHVHYALVPYIAERRRISDFPARKYFCPDWETALDAARTGGKSIVYMPLGFHPESSTDYWVADKRFISYIETIKAIIEEFAKHDTFCIAIKEHVHMLGMRGNDVYEALSKYPNVVSIPPEAYSNHVLQKSDCVLIGTGSVGIEAMVHNRPVFSFCDTSYWFDTSGAYYLELDRLAHWATDVESAIKSYRPKSETEKLDSISVMLSGTAANARMGRVWPIVNPEELAAALTAALSLPPPRGIMHMAKTSAEARARSREELVVGS